MPTLTGIQANGMISPPRIEKKDAEISHHLHKVRWTALHDWKGEDDFGISVAHSVMKLRRDEMFPQPLNDNVEYIPCKE